jgi:hypothetical protein
VAAPIGAIILYVAFAYLPGWVEPRSPPPDAAVMFVNTTLKTLAPSWPAWAKAYRSHRLNV